MMEWLQIVNNRVARAGPQRICSAEIAYSGDVEMWEEERGFFFLVNFGPLQISYIPVG